MSSIIPFPCGDTAGNQADALNYTLNWEILNRVITRIALKSINNLIELKLFLFILDRTIPWKRLRQRISVSEFMNGKSKLNSFGLGIKQSGVYKGLASLKAKGYIIDSRNDENEKYYMINCISMLKHYIEFPLSKNVRPKVEAIIDIISKEMEAMKIKNIPIQGLNLQESLHRAHTIASKMKGGSNKSPIEPTAEESEPTDDEQTIKSVKDLEITLQKVKKETGSIMYSPNAGKETIVYKSMMKKLIKESFLEKRKLVPILSLSMNLWYCVGTYLEKLDPTFVKTCELFDFKDFYKYRYFIYDWFAYVSNLIDGGKRDWVIYTDPDDVKEYIRTSNIHSKCIYDQFVDEKVIQDE